MIPIATQGILASAVPRLAVASIRFGTDEDLVAKDKAERREAKRVIRQTLDRKMRGMSVR